MFDMFEGLPTIFLGITMDPTEEQGLKEPQIVRGLAWFGWAARASIIEAATLLLFDMS